MQTCRLGRTGLVATRIGLGLAAVGRPAYITLGREDDLGVDRSVETMRDRAHELLDAAWASGVRYFDAARSYGLAEEFLASWLQKTGLTRGDLTVASKWGYTYMAGWRVTAEVNEIKDHSLVALRRQIRESRTLLGPWLAVFQIHSATVESGVLKDAAVLGDLARLKQDGLEIGLSVSGSRQSDTIRAATEIRVDGQNLFSVVQATWNVLEQSAADALTDAHHAGLGVIVKEALANGRLVENRAGDAVETTIREIGQAHGDGPSVPTVDSIAIAAALAQPWADVVLSGAVNVSQLESNLAAIDIRLSGAELDEIAALATSPQRYWDARGALPWS